MSKAKVSNPPSQQDKVPFTGVAVTAAKTDDILSESYELSIEDGIVVSVSRLTKAPDVAASSVGRAAQKMWELVRVKNPISKQVDQQESK